MLGKWKYQVWVRMDVELHGSMNPHTKDNYKN